MTNCVLGSRFAQQSRPEQSSDQRDHLETSISTDADVQTHRHKSYFLRVKWNVTSTQKEAHSNPPLWTKDFILATLVNFTISLVFYLLMPTMALYAVKQFAASETISGLASSGFIIGAVIARIFTGKFLDIVGRKRMIVGALVLYTLAALLYPLAGNALLFIGIRVLHGIGFGVSSTAITATIMSTIPAQRRGEGTGYFGLSSTIATAFGPLIALQIVDFLSYDALFYTAAAVGLFSLVGSLLLSIKERTPSATERAQLKNFSPRTFIDPTSMRIASVMLLAGFAYSGVLSFMATFAVERGLTTAASYFFTAYAAAVFISRLFAGRIQDRKGDNAVMYPALILFALGFVVLAFSHTTLMILIAAILIGFGFGITMPSAQAITIKLSPPHRVGLATSTFFLMLDIGVGFGPILLGTLLPVLGFQGLYLGLAGVMLFAIVVYYFVHHRRQPA